MSGAQTGMVAGPYGAVIGAVIGGVMGALSYNPPVAPKLSKAKLDPVSMGQKDFLDQSEHIGEVGDLIQKANDRSNESFQENISKFAPETMSTTGRIGATGLALTGGQLPQGFVAPGPTGRNLNPADLGLTSDDLFKLGTNVTGSGEKMAGELNPFNATATGTLLSPAALLQRRDSTNYFNTNLKNQAAIGQAAAGSINPFASGVGTGMGAFTGGGGLRGFTNLGGSSGPGYGFGQGDTGPTADSQFSATGEFMGGADLSGV